METNDMGISEQFRTLKGFRTANDDTLGSLRSQYKFNMPVAKLKMIAAFYAKAEKRDPALSELYLLDGLSDVGKLASNARITEVRSANAAAGAAFDDIRRNINAKNGYLLSDIASAADIRLERVGKVPGSLCEDVEVRLSCGTEGGCSITFKEKNARCKENSQEVYCFVSAKGTAFAGARLNEICGLFENADVIFAKKLGKGGMLSAMLSSRRSAFVNICGFDGTSGVQSPSILTKEFPDSLLLLVEQSDASPLCRRLADAGLAVRTVGRISDARRLTVVYGGGYPISFSVDFLRAVASAGRVVAVIDDDDLPAKVEKSFSVSLYGEEPAIFDGYFACNGNVYTAMSLSSPGFLSSAEAVIEAVGRLVAAGADYRKVVLDLSCRIGKDVGDDLSMLLGIYRARAELCLMAESNKLADSEEHGFEVFANAPVQDMPVWNKVVERRRGEISVLPPRSGGDGLPDMRDMRLLFDYVHGLIAEGKVLSVAFVGSEGAEAALKNMTCGECETLNEVVPFGSFIVETEKTPDGIPVADRKLQINREN